MGSRTLKILSTVTHMTYVCFTKEGVNKSMSFSCASRDRNLVSRPPFLLHLIRDSWVEGKVVVGVRLNYHDSNPAPLKLS